MRKLFNFLSRFIPSLLIAFFLWTFLQLNKEYEVSIQGVLEYEIPPEIQLVDSLPTSLEVVLKGRGLDLFPYYVGLNQLKLHISLNKFIDNQIIRESHIISLFQEQHPHLSLVRLEGPRQLFLGIKRKIRRTLPVESRMILKPDNGFYAFKSPKFTPPKVTVLAFPTLFEQVNHWPTIDTTILINQYWQHGKVALAQQKEVYVFPSSVEYYVEGRPYYPVERWVPIKVKNKPSGIQIHPIPSYARVYFLIADTSYLNSLLLSVSIDFKDLNLKNPLARLYVEYPRDLIPWIAIVPQIVHYRIRRAF